MGAAALFALMAAACTASGATEPTAPPTHVPTTPELQEVTSQPVEFFGWGAAGEVVYAVETDGGLSWLRFDPLSGETQGWSGPGPTTSALERIGAAAGTQVQGTIVAPSGGKILYERLPEGYTEPKPGAQPADAFPLYELWAADGDGGGQVRIEPDFAGRCGMLEGGAVWLRDESLVIGECSPYLGLPAFFVADLNAVDLDVLFFTDPLSGEQVRPGQLTVAGDGSWLAFVDIPRTSLWRLPIDGLQEAIGGPLDPAGRLPTEGVILSPDGSAVGGWIYYWHSLPFGPDTDACDVSLQRIDPETGETGEALSKQALVSLLGLNEYASLTLCGIEPDWKLSANGSRFLLRILDTINTEPRLLIVSLAGGG